MWATLSAVDSYAMQRVVEEWKAARTIRQEIAAFDGGDL